MNTRIDPRRVPTDEATRISSLVMGVNIDIDDTMRISRRNCGSTASAITSECHSLFSYDDTCLYITADKLYRLNADYATVDKATQDGVRSGLTVGKRMYYVGVGRQIYYSNGIENGVYELDSGTSHVWTAEDYVGPDTMKVMSSPPAMKHLELYNGRIYGCEDNTIWYTQPFAFSWVDKARNYIPFPSKVIMIRSVIDGLYVSTKTQTFFLSGPDAPEFQVIKCADYPAVEDTDVSVEGVWVNDSLYVKAVFWMGYTGICVGLPGGQFSNRTQKKIVLPPGRKGAGVFIDGRYIALIEP